MQASLHLTFNGQCEAAFTFYEQMLGGKLGPMLRYGDSPAASDVPSEWRDKIVHGSITVGGVTLAGADVRPEQYKKPQGFFVLLNIADVTEATRMFESLAQNGVIHMPMQKTFWSPGFGVVVDSFGVPWEISCG
jgi:PhnB protein